MHTPSLSDSWTSQCQCVCRYLEFITMFSQILITISGGFATCTSFMFMLRGLGWKECRCMMHVEIENNVIILYIYCRYVISSSYLWLVLCYDALLNLDGSSILNCQKCCLSFYRSSLCQTTP